jgi:hypothetical protein
MRSVHLCTLVGLIIILSSARADRPSDGREPAQAARPAKELEGDLDYISGKTQRITLQGGTVELETKYGKLTIPAADIERIDFAFRLPEEVAKRIAAAVERLGNEAFEVREGASRDLLEIGVRAYPALEIAAKDSDAEASRRAALLLKDIRARAPADHLRFLKMDHIQTTELTANGRITSEVLRVRDARLGTTDLKLADLCSFQVGSAPKLSGAYVKGRVTLQGKAVAGEVIFTGPDGRKASAKASLDGSFLIQNPPLGMCKITIVQIPGLAPPPPEVAQDKAGTIKDKVGGGIRGAKPLEWTIPPAKYANPDNGLKSYEVKPGRHEYDIRLTP